MRDYLNPSTPKIIISSVVDSHSAMHEEILQLDRHDVQLARFRGARKAPNLGANIRFLGGTTLAANHDHPSRESERAFICV